MSNIDELKEAIRKLHGVESTHIESVPIKETFQGRTVWEGVVDVFELHGHSEAKKAYAWSHEAGNQAKRHVAVLHVGPITSALHAVRAAIIQEYRDAQEA